METPHIQPIAPEETWALRHRVMWPAHPLSYVQLPEDGNGLHYGLFLGEQLISVASLFVQGEQAQFRKFATDTFYQGQRYGAMLLHHILQLAPALPVARVWCNARREKAAYYQKFGFTETAHTFEKSGMGFVVMEKRYP
ncbi:GNAT family N-acetyltransferase [Rufibacter quisquiliarum]|uniref:GNAT superfamily N-acetyltransferase n=1 Tax=Rufibacter quisquiliarum TaxID=1549639 RepID=A0A839H1T9_9BACT|nr:GNAT family N-acetyltransferase [Rufibacter quisquiliarum]MBA9079851.1 GNAT superfamily N-acetyltransferase [Rufibacter quisquiliarum]